MSRVITSSLAVCALLLPALAFAGNPQMYKWTDDQGVVHYSDQPPNQDVADVKTLDIPVFPPVDPVQLAQEQAALTAQLVALRALLQTQSAQRQQAAALAEKEALLQAALDALQQMAAAEARETASPIYVASAFVPRVYRRNLYVSRQPPGHVEPPLLMRIGTPGPTLPVKP